MTRRIQKTFRTYSRVNAIIISFPKSGRTWLRQMIDHAIVEQYGLSEEPMKLFVWSKKQAQIPGFEARHRLSTLEWEILKNKKYILLVWDSRDVVMSCYYWKINREDYEDRGMSEFLKDEDHGIRAVVEHTNTWLKWLHKSKAPKLVISYEQMHKNPDDVPILFGMDIAIN